MAQRLHANRPISIRKHSKPACSLWPREDVGTVWNILTTAKLVLWCPSSGGDATATSRKNSVVIQHLWTTTVHKILNTHVPHTVRNQTLNTFMQHCLRFFCRIGRFWSFPNIAGLWDMGYLGGDSVSGNYYLTHNSWHSVFCNKFFSWNTTLPSSISRAAAFFGIRFMEFREICSNGSCHRFPIVEELRAPIVNMVLLDSTFILNFMWYS